MVRLYVGGLPADVTCDQLAQRFAPFGRVDGADLAAPQVDGCEVLKDASCRGFGYVELEPTDEAALRRCLSTANPHEPCCHISYQCLQAAGSPVCGQSLFVLPAPLACIHLMVLCPLQLFWQCMFAFVSSTSLLCFSLCGQHNGCKRSCGTLRKEAVRSALFICACCVSVPQRDDAHGLKWALNIHFRIPAAQYNGCKWRGGTLRVEAARPAFHLRLVREWAAEAARQHEQCKRAAAREQEAARGAEAVRVKPPAELTLAVPHSRKARLLLSPACVPATTVCRTCAFKREHFRNYSNVSS